MASIQKKGGSFSCQFCYLGRRHTLTLGNLPRAEGPAVASRPQPGAADPPGRSCPS
jgi:hypothetical protein